MTTRVKIKQALEDKQKFILANEEYSYPNGKTARQTVAIFKNKFDLLRVVLKKNKEQSDNQNDHPISSTTSHVLVSPIEDLINANDWFNSYRTIENDSVAIQRAKTLLEGYCQQ
ncbi:hypothetical protein [Ligilactobacillus equi]|uniref:Uncharacterized protein n=1 Tax=Ligilactobacillus equi DSM 15833 = JCM 10991 TaxID=1423740 RepID=A0A0R1TZZ0_9LACO|nr:hypothetical protein [Ligilactobacillus equi]KRL84440.1 hypothetical protein FC36_GL000198 [Ligilactobacillus equi DSM 15833 = JCM 10991]